MEKLDRSILLFGASGSGKTTQSALMAQWVKQHYEWGTHVYTADKGGYIQWEPYAKAFHDFISVTDLRQADPWDALEQAVAGQSYEQNPKSGIWEAPKPGLWVFESCVSWCDLMSKDIANNLAKGKRIGSSSGLVQKMSPEVSLVSLDKPHYGMIQNRIKDLIDKSLFLPGIKIWTTLDSRAKDEEGGSLIVGPAMIGKALADKVPQWFQYTFHLVVQSAGWGKEDEHVLYIRGHKDDSVGGLMAHGNDRIPMWLNPQTKQLERPQVPGMISPANVPLAMELLLAASTEVEQKLKELNV